MNIVNYWTTFFGMEKDAFNDPGIHFVPHASLGDYWGIWIFIHGELVIVSSPESFVARCRELLSNLEVTCLGDPDFVSRCFEPYLERIIGPAYHGTLITQDFTPTDTRNCREISRNEAASLDDRSDPLGWDWSGCGNDKAHFFGVFQDDALAAVSNYEIKKGVLAFPGVFVHPRYRGNGFAKVALSYAFEHSLAAGLLMDYQTLLKNTAAIKAAESLGVQYFARHIAIRLKSETS